MRGPRSLRTDDGRSLLVDAPQLVPLDKQLAFFGSLVVAVSDSARIDTREPRGTDASLHAGATLRSDGRVSTIPLPPGYSGGLMLPRAVRAVPGSVDVLWSEPANEQLPRDRILWSLWNGERWAPVREVDGEPDGKLWNDLGTSNIAHVEGMPWMIASHGFEQNRLSHVLRRTGETWQSEPVPDVSGGALAVASSDDSVRLVAYIAGRAPHGNTVLVRRSADRGRTWSEERRIGGDAVKQAQWPQLFHADHGVYALAWSGVDERGTDVLMLSWSSDHGETWSTEAPLVADGPIHPFRGAVDRQGRLHFILHILVGGNTPSAVPAYVVWDRGRWIRAWSASEQVVAFGVPGIAVVDDSAVVLAWGEQRGTYGVTWPGTQYVAIHYRCTD